MDIIYVVYGAEGDYPDDTWLIAAYTEEKHAIRHVKEAAKRAKEIIDEIKDTPDWKPSDYPNDFDKDMRMDELGPTYWCEALDMYGDILEYKLMI